MGLLDKILNKSDPEEEKQEVFEGKYSQECAMCGNPGTEKKWAGQYWHKKCMRQAKKAAKKMI